MTGKNSRSDSISAVSQFHENEQDRDKQTDTNNFEEILEKTGGFGRFQWLVLIALLVPEIPAAFVAFAPVFVGRQARVWQCETTAAEDASFGNTSVSDYLQYPLYYNDIEVCNKCNGSYFSLESSIVAEWKLICGSAWVSDFLTSIQMFGMLTGSFFSSQISDWYGRKYTYLGVCTVMMFGQGLSAVAPNPVVYAIARFLCGAGLSGFMGMSTIYPLEFLTPKWRLLCGSIGPWGEGVMLLALLAYFVQPWRVFLALSSLPFLFVAITLPFIPESPRWLLRNKKISEAVQVVRKIQHVNTSSGNDFQVTEEMLEKVSEEESRGTSGKSRFSYLDFFRESELRTKTLLLMGIWFAWSLVYFGISYNIKNLRGDPYLNVMYMGLSDAIGYPAALLINNKLGRRKSLIVFMVIGAFFLVTLSVLDLVYGVALTAAAVASLCLLGKFGVAGARSSARCLTGESFPTPIRTMGYGISGVTAGIGGIIAPQIAFFGSQWWKQLPFLTFAFISVGGAFLSLMLPETAGKTLQEKIGTVSNTDVAKNEIFHQISLTDENKSDKKVHL